MRQNGFNIGGEQSGHIILSDFTTTGDGLVAALQVLQVMQSTGKPVSEICDLFEKIPQILLNVKFDEGKPLENSAIIDLIARCEAKLGDSGRLLVRASGTESLIRIMGQGDDKDLVEGLVSEISEAIKAAC